MTLPSTINTAVSQAAITKATRLFNGSIGDVLAELLQNARRAGATGVDIDLTDADGRRTLCVRDDGSGIADPRDVVTLGRSGWGEDLAGREDPAGMGMFSLAGRYVVIRSRPGEAQRDWQVAIEPADWEASAPIAVEPVDMDPGTTILFELPDAWAGSLNHAVAEASLSYPLPVRFADAEQPRRDWLGECVHVEDWQGTRIGVLHGSRTSGQRSHINFHGVTIACALPTIGEADRNKTWSVLVDIVDAPTLQLVLPARKEMVQNAALEELRLACKAAIYHAIAKQPGHRLSHEEWTAARAIGVELPEADPYLFGWLPPTNDSSFMGQMGEQLRDVPMIVMPDVEPDIGNSAARALLDGKALDARIVLEEPAFAGYSWYDAIPKIDDLQFVVTSGNETQRLFQDATPLPESVNTSRVDAIYLRLAFVNDTKPVTYVPTDVLVVDAGYCGSLDETVILLTQDAAITVGQLTELLQRAVFSDDEDSASDSYDTQEANFAREAKQVAMTLLLGEEAAILARIEDLLADEAMFLLPNERAVSITVAKGKASARFEEAQQLPAVPA